MDTVLRFLLVMVLCLLAATITITWRAVRGVRRSRSATGWWTRGLAAASTFERRRLGVMAVTRPGPRGELAGMRLAVRDAIASTNGSLAAARASGRPVGRLPEIVADLAATGASLDGQLQLAERDPDPGNQAHIAATLRPQVDRLIGYAATLRRTLADAASSATVRDLDDAAADLSNEVGAVGHGAEAYSSFGKPEPFPR